LIGIKILQQVVHIVNIIIDFLEEFLDILKASFNILQPGEQKSA